VSFGGFEAPSKRLNQFETITEDWKLVPLINASPDELGFTELKSPSSSRLLIVAAGLLVLSFFATAAFGAQEQTVQPASPSRTKNQPGTAKSKSKTPAQPTTKPKATASAKRKAKPAARPKVSEITKTKAEKITSEIAPALPENLEKELTKFFGLRYQLGGQGKSGFDCSGLVQRVYSDVFGVKLPRSSSAQSQVGNLEKVTEDDLKIGDLLFFGPKRKRVNHVGMYLASGYFFHAARSEGVTISRLDDGYWKSRWMFSKRVKGFEIESDSDEEKDLERALEQFSAGFTFAGDDSANAVSFLEGGLKITDSLEFLLSGYFRNALDDHSLLSDPLLDSSALPASGLDEMESSVRLDSILSPLDWFKLIPSVTHFTDTTEGENGDGDFQRLGLETRMILPSARVAVFMAAHALNQEDLLENPLSFSPDWQTLDLTLGVDYRLSDSLRFSLLGTHSYTSDFEENDESGQPNTPLDDVSFRLQLQF
jgi:cell wall-associated NlpC family hydrolase